MAGKTPIPVARAQREISSNLELARRQQRITLDLLAERANISVPTLRSILNEGKGSFENVLRVARILGLMDGIVRATDPLNTPLGRIRAEEDVPKRVRSKGVKSSGISKAPIDATASCFESGINRLQAL